MKDGKVDQLTVPVIKLICTLTTTKDYSSIHQVIYILMSLSNSYSLKTVAIKDQRPCFICGKLSSSVFDAADDFFFCLLVTYKGLGFCTSSAIKNEIQNLEKIPESKTAESQTEIDTTNPLINQQVPKFTNFIDQFCF